MRTETKAGLKGCDSEHGPRALEHPDPFLYYSEISYAYIKTYLHIHICIICIRICIYTLMFAYMYRRTFQRDPEKNVKTRTIRNIVWTIIDYQSGSLVLEHEPSIL